MRRLVELAVLIALVAPATAKAHTDTGGVTIRAAIVNPDRSITLAWSLASANVVNSWIAVDGNTVRGGSDRATAFRTMPLSGGWHTITIEVREFFETYSPHGADCRESGSHWVCARAWRSSTTVSIPIAKEAACTVPHVVGLRLAVAKARIGSAGCSLGSVKRVPSARPTGTVLRQRRTGAAISLIVSGGPRSRT